MNEEEEKAFSDAYYKYLHGIELTDKDIAIIYKAIT